LKTIEQVRRQLHEGSFDFSRHARRRVFQRNIAEQDIRQAGLRAVIIEEYPDDKYSPSCLLLGFTRTGRALHIQVSLAETPMVRIVTLYEPSPEEWIDNTRRR
jgi:hypothetical protein